MPFSKKDKSLNAILNKEEQNYNELYAMIMDTLNSSNFEIKYNALNTLKSVSIEEPTFVLRFIDVLINLLSDKDEKIADLAQSIIVSLGNYNPYGILNKLLSAIFENANNGNIYAITVPNKLGRKKLIAPIDNTLLPEHYVFMEPEWITKFRAALVIGEIVKKQKYGKLDILAYLKKQNSAGIQNLYWVSLIVGSIALNKPEIVKPLLKNILSQLSSKSYLIQENALMALAGFARSYPKLLIKELPKIENFLQNGTVEQRFWALEIVGNLAKKYYKNVSNMVPLVLSYLYSENTNLLRNAIWVVSIIAKKDINSIKVAIPRLFQLAIHQDEKVRFWSQNTLYYLASRLRKNLTLFVEQFYYYIEYSEFVEFAVTISISLLNRKNIDEYLDVTLLSDRLNQILMITDNENLISEILEFFSLFAGKYPYLFAKHYVNTIIQFVIHPNYNIRASALWTLDKLAEKNPHILLDKVHYFRKVLDSTRKIELLYLTLSIVERLASTTLLSSDKSLVDALVKLAEYDDSLVRKKVYSILILLGETALADELMRQDFDE